MGGFLKKLIEKLQQPIEIKSERMAAVALLVLAILILIGAIIYPPMSLRQEYLENLERLRVKLAKTNKVIALKEPLTQRLDHIKHLSSNNESFLPTTTAALASAELQTKIKQVVTEAGGEVASTQAILEKPEENVTRVGVKVRLAGSTSILRNVLHAFEAGKPALFIDNLNIRPIRAPGRPGEGFEDKLSVDFDVIGYMQSQQP